MGYRYMNKKTSYSKMTIEKLKLIKSNLLAKCPDLEDIENKYHEEEKRIASLKENYKNINDKIEMIRKTAQNRAERQYANSGLFKRIFINRNIPEYTEHEKNELNRLFQTRSEKYGDRFDYNKYRYQYEIHLKIQKIQKYISQREAREEKKKTDRAVIAAYKGKTRNLAGQIKNNLKDQLNIDPHCPYCGQFMDKNPHCDHIYPVSKGGLSTPKNMVFICSDCNTKKTDLTLMQFIRKNHLSRRDIEDRLDRLGKDY
jgi:5-methylcytosine-specific restriction endonuclease McrA